jgi:hypothetical protein
VLLNKNVRSNLCCILRPEFNDKIFICFDFFIDQGKRKNKTFMSRIIQSQTVLCLAFNLATNGMSLRDAEKPQFFVYFVSALCRFFKAYFSHTSVDRDKPPPVPCLL